MLQTALHWAAKHGDENIVKLIAGTYRAYINSVNETTVSLILDRFASRIFGKVINLLIFFFLGICCGATAHRME